MGLLAKNIVFIRKKISKTQVELANLLGVTPHTVANWESGRRAPDYDTLVKLANLGRVSLDWLIKGESNTRIGIIGDSEIKYISLEEAEKNDVKLVTEYKIAGVVPAGIADMEDYFDWEGEDINYDPSNHVFLRVNPENGYSMAPLLQPGDLVLIDLNSKPVNGDLVAARWDDTQGAIKILTLNEKDPDNVVLTSFNSSIPPIFLKRAQIKAITKIVNIKKKN